MFFVGRGKWIGVLVRKNGVRDQRDEFVEFYETNKDRCLRAVAASVVDPHLAEELVAEAFARAWRSWVKVSRHPAPVAWVVRTAANTRVSWWRRRRREVPLAAHDPASPDHPGEDIETGVMVALERLPARQREVITLRLLLDLDTETTAQVLGIAPGTVNAHLSRAISYLRGQLPLTNPQHHISEVIP
jgi:RNA polymerase sigma-70 factor (sigma-E family)